MKEVKKCSLSGVAFVMDIDAFHALDIYLKSLRKAYADTADGDEITADIEARIAELILSAQPADRVVEAALIQDIISQMGTAEDIAHEHGADPSDEPRIPRRLYRDTERARLGGVCAGIGRYFDIDPIWVRMGIFVPLVLSSFGWIPFLYWTGPMMGNLFGIIVICYLIMWFAVPAARTARQRLEMTGERITAQSIGETTRAASAADPDRKAKPIVAEVVSMLGKVVLILLKMLAGLLVFALIMTASALIVAASALLVGGHDLPISHGLLADVNLWTLLLGIFVVLMPVLLLIYSLMCLIASRKPGGKTVVVFFVVWILGIVAFTSMAVHEKLGDRYRLKRDRMERLMENTVRVDGITMSVEELLDAFAHEKVVEDDGEEVHIRIPSKHIEIRIDKRESEMRIVTGGRQVAPADSAAATKSSGARP